MIRTRPNKRAMSHHSSYAYKQGRGRGGIGRESARTVEAATNPAPAA